MTKREKLDELKTKFQELSERKQDLDRFEQEFLALQNSYLGLCETDKTNLLTIFDKLYSFIEE